MRRMRQLRPLAQAAGVLGVMVVGAVLLSYHTSVEADSPGASVASAAMVAPLAWRAASAATTAPAAAPIATAAAGTKASARRHPRLDICRSLAVPWVGQTVTYSATLSAAPAGSRWRVTLDISARAPKSRHQEATLTADARGGAKLDARELFSSAAWYDVRAQAVELAPGGSRHPLAKRLSASLRVPVTARRVDFAWYGAGAGHELRYPTMLVPCPDDQAAYWRKRGVICCHWCGAACGKEKPKEHFVQGWSSHDFVSIDEFMGDEAAMDKFISALREVRKARPREFIAGWFTGAEQYWPQMRGLLDVFMPEIYLNYGTYTLHRFDAPVAQARKSGVFDEMLMGLGINVVKNKQGQVLNRPTAAQVVEQVAYLKRIAPDLRGLAFFTYNAADRAVRAAADRACEAYFLRPVADLVSARITPARAKPGAKAEAVVTLRNAGMMPGHGLQVRLRAGGTSQVVWTGDLDAQQQREVRVPWQPRPGWHRIAFEVSAPKGWTVLRREADAVTARLPGDAPLAYAPPARAAGAGAAELPASAPRDRMVLLPASQTEGLGNTSQAMALAADGGASRNTSPVDALEGPEGRHLVWLDTGQPSAAGKLWELGTGAREGAAAPAPAARIAGEGSVFTVSFGHARLILDAAQDAITSIKYRAGGETHEILASPWKMSWDAWRGFGKPQVEHAPLGPVITVPVHNELIEGYSRYAFLGPCVEITRWFKPVDAETVEVTQATEGAHLAQRAGSYATLFGVDSSVRRGRLQEGSQGRDLYFGQISLSPGFCRDPGWLDFAWDRPYGVGLGVVLAKKWTTQASRVGYDITRLYDGSDWIEVAEIWGKRTAVGSDWSRLYLVPHGPMNVDDAKVEPPAEAVFDAIHHPAQRL